MGIPIFVEFTAGLGGFMSGLDGAEAGITRLARSGESGFASLSKAAPIMGGAILIAAAAIAGEAVKMAADFQQSMTKLATTAGESQSNLKMVGDGILAMAGKVGISADELAKGMYTVESAGYHGADALKVLAASAQGARQENADLSKVTDAVSTALRDYHLPASDAALVTSQLITAVSHGKTTFDELTGSLHSLTPIASAAGISLADATGVLSSMTASGMSADQAAQNLGATIGRLAAPTQPMIKELGALGLNANELSKNLGKAGVSGTMQEVANAILQHMGPAGTTLLSTMNESTQAGANAAKMFASLPPALQNVATQYKNGQVDLSQYRKEIKGVPGDQRMLINSWKTMEDSSNGFSQALKSGKSDTQTYLSALKQATGGQEGLTVALQTTGQNAAATNAAIKDIAGASAQADGSIKGWSEVQGNFNQKMAELHATIGSLMIRLGQQLLPIVTQVADGFLKFFDFLSTHQAVAEAIAVVLGVVLVAALVAVGVAFVAATWEIILIVAAIALVVAGVVIFVTHWKQNWAQVVQIAHEVWAAITSAISTAWNAIASFFVGIFNRIKANFTTVWNGITGFLSGIWNSITSAVSTAWNAVHDTTARVFGAIGSFFSKWWPLLLAIFAPVIFIIMALWNHFHQVVFDTAIAVWGAIKSFLSTTWNVISGTARAAWNLFYEYVVAPIQRLWGWLQGTWNTIVGFLGGVWGRIVSAASSAWNSVTSTISGAINGARSAVSGTVQGIFNDITGIFGRILSWLWGLGSQFVSIGASIVSGIISGISGAAGGLMSTLSGLASNALSAAKNALLSQSPSRRFADEVGQWIPKGIAAGVNEHAESAHAAVRNLAAGLTSSAQIGLSGVGTGGIGGGSSAGGVTQTVLLDVPIKVQIDGQTLFTSMQTIALRYEQRNGTQAFALSGAK